MVLLDPLSNQVSYHHYQLPLTRNSFLDVFSQESADEIDVFPGSFCGLLADELGDVEGRLGFI